jgi:phage-related protein
VLAASIIRVIALMMNLLPVTTSSFIFFAPNGLKKVVILILPVALRTSATQATEFKTLMFNVSFPGKNCIR